MMQETQWKYFSLNFLVAFIPLCTLCSLLLFYAYSAEISADRKIIQAHERSKLDLQQETIAKDFDSIVADLITISASHELRKIIEDDSHHLYDLENDLLALSQNKKVYDQIRYLDETGMEVVRINFNQGKPFVVDAAKLQNKARRYYFKDIFALSKDNIFISPFDLNIEHGQIEKTLKPVIRFGMPLFNKNGEKRGVLLLNYLGSKIIERLYIFSGRGGGHLDFFNQDGYWLKGVDPDDEWGFMYDNGKDKTIRIKYPQVWQKILSSDSGQFTAGKRLFTYKTFYPLSDSRHSSTGANVAFKQSASKIEGQEYFFKIVSHVESSFLRKEAEKVFQRLFLVYLMAIVTTLIVSFIFAYFRESRYRIQLEREQLVKELKTTLKEVKTLKGLIPICASCKKIRDDKGIWNRIEEYISEHSEAEFTHSYCNDCIRELYPEMADEVIAEINANKK